MTHFCRPLMASQPGTPDQCDACQGHLTEDEIARRSKAIRQPRMWHGKYGKGFGPPRVQGR